MAITAVKATKGVATAGTSVTFSVNATAGNTLIAGGSGFMNTTTSGAYSVTRTGDTYTTDTEGNTSAATDICHVGIASAPNVAGGAVNMVVTVSSAQGVAGFALELSGLPTSAIKDANSPAIAIGTGTTATSNALTNATADAVYIGVVGSESGANPATVNDGSGWTDNVGGVTMTNTNGSNSPVSGMTYQIVASASSRTVSWTVSSADWGAVIAVYKADGAAAVKPKTLATLGVG